MAGAKHSPGQILDAEKSDPPPYTPQPIFSARNAASDSAKSQSSPGVPTSLWPAARSTVTPSGFDRPTDGVEAATTLAPSTTEFRSRRIAMAQPPSTAFTLGGTSSWEKAAAPSVQQTSAKSTPPEYTLSAWQQRRTGVTAGTTLGISQERADVSAQPASKSETGIVIKTEVASSQSPIKPLYSWQQRRPLDSASLKSGTSLDQSATASDFATGSASSTGETSTVSSLSGTTFISKHQSQDSGSLISKSDKLGDIRGTGTVSATKFSFEESSLHSPENTVTSKQQRWTAAPSHGQGRTLVDVTTSRSGDANKKLPGLSPTTPQSVTSPSLNTKDEMKEENDKGDTEGKVPGSRIFSKRLAEKVMLSVPGATGRRGSTVDVEAALELEADFDELTEDRIGEGLRRRRRREVLLTGDPEVDADDLEWQDELESIRTEWASPLDRLSEWWFRMVDRAVAWGQTVHIMPNEEDVAREMRVGKEKFSNIDTMARRVFPAAFALLVAIYYVLYMYYLTDDFPVRQYKSLMTRNCTTCVTAPKKYPSRVTEP